MIIASYTCLRCEAEKEVELVKRGPAIIRCPNCDEMSMELILLEDEDVFLDSFMESRHE